MNLMLLDKLYEAYDENADEVLGRLAVNGPMDLGLKSQMVEKNEK